MRRLVVVRNPYARLVSLYADLARWNAARGFGTTDFGPFCRSVVAGQVEPFYAWTLNQWLAQTGDVEILRVESLADDLKVVGLEATLPHVNASFYRKPSQEFYNAELIAVVRLWAAPDCERWGYRPDLALENAHIPRAAVSST